MAKRLKIKLPKRVAGVKIPKSVRKGPLAGFLNSTAGQIVIAEALVAVSGVLAAKGTEPDSAADDLLRHPVEGAKRAARSTADAAEEVKDHAAAQGARLSYALSEAVKTFRSAMERDDREVEQHLETSGDPTVEAQPLGKKKHATTAAH